MALLIRLAARAAVAACLLATVPGAVPAGVAQDSLERDVKAAYLFNFTKFVQWPAEARVSDEFRLCVVADPRFAAALEAIIRGESADGRPLVKLEPDTADAARTCQILYIGDGAAGGRQLLAELRDLPILTVGETSGFLERGGIIRFATVEGRVRFDISMPAYRRAGLDVSSKLLRVARGVIRDSP